MILHRPSDSALCVKVVKVLPWFAGDHQLYAHSADVALCGKALPPSEAVGESLQILGLQHGWLPPGNGHSLAQWLTGSFLLPWSGEVSLPFRPVLFTYN